MSDSDGVLIYERFDGDKKLTVLINRSAREITYINEGGGRALISGACGDSIVVPPDSAEIIKS